MNASASCTVSLCECWAAAFLLHQLVQLGPRQLVQSKNTIASFEIGGLFPMQLCTYWYDSRAQNAAECTTPVQDQGFIAQTDKQ